MWYIIFGKRCFDVLASVSALICLSPVLAVSALIIWLDDGSPVIFRQTRSGRYGIGFEIMKFRSMRKNMKEVTSAAADANMIIRTGAFFRRTNIDELPQLINILFGDMSVVGPRPCLMSQRELIKLRTCNGAIDCRPGLTGLAQINSYDGMPEKEKADWDGKYASAISFFGDLVIIFRTFGYLLHRPPKY